MTVTLPDGHKAERVRVFGRVQGVWYRGWTVDQATRRGLKGWVRNRRDGSVEALFVGPAERVDDMIEACRTGPSTARVDDIERTPVRGVVADGFVQKPTI